jgi:hypothetical protein
MEHLKLNNKKNKKKKNKKNNYVLGICVLYNPILHGFTNTYFYGHFLYYFKINKILNNISLSNTINNHRNFLRYNNNNYINIPHPIIQNYKTIIFHKYFINVDIIELITFTDIEGFQITCAIKKTFWLRIIQRKWKNIFKKRKIIFEKRKNPISLFYREINGYWPKNCFYSSALL